MYHNFRCDGIRIITLRLSYLNSFTVCINCTVIFCHCITVELFKPHVKLLSGKEEAEHESWYVLVHEKKKKKLQKLIFFLSEFLLHLEAKGSAACSNKSVSLTLRLKAVRFYKQKNNDFKKDNKWFEKYSFKWSLRCHVIHCHLLPNQCKYRKMCWNWHDQQP